MSSRTIVWWGQWSVFWQYIHITAFEKSHPSGLVQDYSNSIAYALELLQSWTKPSTCSYLLVNSSPPSAVYASVGQISIGSDNGLAPIWRQAMI